MRGRAAVSIVSEGIRAVSARRGTAVLSAAGGKFPSLSAVSGKLPSLPAVCAILCAVGILCLVLAVLTFRSYQRQREKDRLVDPLTGRGSREALISRLDGLFRSGSRQNSYLACYSFDIAWVNRIVGREASEQLLCRMAGAFPAESRSSACGRAAGGAVALLFDAAGDQEARQAAGSYFSLFNGYAREATGEYGVCVSGSLLPLRLVPSDGKYALKYALQAIPQGDLPEFTVCTEESLRQVLEDAALMMQVPEALEKRKFHTYFQPIVTPENGKIAGGEVLSRMEAGENMVVSPGRFLGMIHELNLGTRFDFYMFERACAWLERLDEDGFSEIWITCNFSRRTISAEEFPDRLEALAEEYHFHRQNLILEITEEELESSWSTAFENIRRCRRMGYRIAIDDFGAGYTTFRNLLNYEVDLLKLDRELVLSVETERGRNLIREIISLAHGLGTRVVCEGVETKDVCELLKSCGCDYIQGYYYARPMPFGESLRILWEEKLG